MAIWKINDTTLTGIADAIRDKLGETVEYPVQSLADKIASISGGDVKAILYNADVTQNINGSPATISLDSSSVDWLVIFPASTESKGQYAMSGGVYVPALFGSLDRTSYGSTVWSTIGCRAGSEITVNNGILTLSKSQNTFIYEGSEYFIVYR